MKRQSSNKLMFKKLFIDFFIVYSFKGEINKFADCRIFLNENVAWISDFMDNDGFTESPNVACFQPL